MERISNLLSQVAIIGKKNTEILDATGGRFNMFRVCGVNHYENTHSAIIAEFLNPNGTHGLKSKLLECFIETLGDYFTVQTFNCEKSRVITEHPTEEGRIDILIEDNQNKAIIIENKIYANDQFEQLKRYDRYAQKYKNGYQILYLTLFGDSASEHSGSGVSYLSISHKENIISWLEKCVSIASRFPIVRETIIQYINHLKQLTNQDMDTK
ncbi:PD-(D/E)XK nuclease family protein, partial [Flavobacterium nitrogenifigens]|uniref:PDDEXK-like family protein n=1 Tax=Flavobacterium nitrogenifigens TaxID=1617283 RepID=UPI0031B3CA6F